VTVIKLIGISGFLLSAALCQVPTTLTVQGIGGTSATLSVSGVLPFCFNSSDPSGSAGLRSPMNSECDCWDQENAVRSGSGALFR
jgi:hypothetical protein